MGRFSMVPIGRSKRHWLHIATLGLACCILALPAAACASNPAEVNRKPPQQGSAPGTGEQTQIKAPIRQIQNVAPGNPKAEANQTKGGDKKEIELGSWPDWAIVAFTLVLTVVGIQQYRLDSKLANEGAEAIALARQSADAATAAAQATLASVEAYRNAERAWIGPMGMTVGFSSGWLDGNPVREGFVFTIQLMNTGNTPDIHVQSRITHLIRDIGDEVVPAFDVVHDFNGSMSASAMKGLAFSPPIRMLHDADTNQFRERRVKVYAYCRVQYESSLSPGQPCVTEICLMGTYNGEVTDPASGMRHPNINWSPIGDQNRAT